MQQVENELDNTLEKLGGTNVKLDEKDKAYQLAEGEAAALQSLPIGRGRSCG